MTSSSSTNNEPKFQETKVPLYSFLNNEEQTSLDNKSSTADKKQQQQQPPLPTMSKMLTILIPEYKGLLPAATMQYPNAIGEIIDILSASNIAMLDVDTTASAVTSSGIIEASSDISSMYSNSRYTTSTIPTATTSNAIHITTNAILLYHRCSCHLYTLGLIR